MMYNARLMFNHPGGKASMFSWLAGSPGEVFHPDPPFHVDLTGILPAFVPIDGASHPINSGLAIAMSVAVVLLCYLLMKRRLDSWSDQGLGSTLRAIVWLGAISLVGAGWITMNYDFLKNSITLVQHLR